MESISSYQRYVTEVTNHSTPYLKSKSDLLFQLSPRRAETSLMRSLNKLGFLKIKQDQGLTDRAMFKDKGICEINYTMYYGHGTKSWQSIPESKYMLFETSDRDDVFNSKRYAADKNPSTTGSAHANKRKLSSFAENENQVSPSEVDNASTTTQLEKKRKIHENNVTTKDELFDSTAYTFRLVKKRKASSVEGEEDLNTKRRKF